jgi:hypothetical protein
VRYFDKDELRRHPELVRQAALFVRAARQERVSPELPHDFIELAVMTAINGDAEPWAAPAAQQPIIAAIVTSTKGVLVGRRNDRTPPWTFIAGELDPVNSLRTPQSARSRRRPALMSARAS